MIEVTKAKTLDSGRYLIIDISQYYSHVKAHIPFQLLTIYPKVHYWIAQDLMTIKTLQLSICNVGSIAI